MASRNKMWTIETVDSQEREGLDVIFAPTEEEARKKFKKMHPRCDCEITSCETTLALSLAEVRGELGETYYFETYREREDGSIRTFPAIKN